MTQQTYDVYLGLGSNINPEKNLTAALEELSNQFSNLILSNTYKSTAVGFEGPDFWNLVVKLNTNLTLQKLRTYLRNIEFQFGRDQNAQKYSSRTVDIDILLFDELNGVFNELVLPREEITFNAFVLKPLSELNPNGIHPITGKSYQQMWQNFEGNQELQLVKIGHEILSAQQNTQNFSLTA